VGVGKRIERKGLRGSGIGKRGQAKEKGKRLAKI